MKKTFALFLLGLALAPALAGAAAPQDATRCADGRPAGGHCKALHLDSNKDGFVSREEASGAPRLLQKFDQLDGDRDGRLSMDELRRARPHRGAQRADSNRDNYVSRQEALEFRPLLERFDQLDSNHDGMLSQDELHKGPRPRRDGPPPLGADPAAKK